MKTLFGTLALGLMLATTGPATATDPTGAASDIHVSRAWLRILPGNLPAGGYAVIRNDGDAAHDIVGASSKAYGDVMLHQSSNEGGMAHMRMLHKLGVPAHGKVELAPGGYHLMLMNARHPVKPGDTVPVTLRFADGTTLDVGFIARPANASGPAPATSS